MYHYSNNIPTEDEDKKAQRESRDAEESALEATATAVTLEGDLEMSNLALQRSRMDHSPITPPEEWPQYGVVEFVDVKMRYRDGPLVLKGVSFKIGSHDHVGIAGRTG